MKRCEWAPLIDELYVNYHDLEWGVPVFDSLKLFEFLILEGFQAGLSWSTILKKRENFRKAFHDFDPIRVSRYNENDVQRLLADSGIVRNRLKIRATIENAKKFEAIQENGMTFSAFLWQFVGRSPRINQFETMSEIPAETDESKAMSKALKERGFRFVGPTICYAFMQAVGMVNDHVIGCFRYDEINKTQV